MDSLKYKIKYIFTFLFVLSAIQLLVSCNEEPTSMGSTLLNDTITVYPISTNSDTLITKVGSYHYDFISFNFGVILIGKSKGYEAVSLLRFNEFIKYIDTLDYLKDYTVDKIISCKVTMSVNRYAFGSDSSNPSALSFKVYPVTTKWDTTTTWKNLDGIIDKSKLGGQYNGYIELKDTIPDIEFDLDKDLVLGWIKKWYEFKKGDSLSIVYGVAFVPDENSTVIRSFNGPTSDKNISTKLTIAFLDSTNTPDTINIDTDVDKPFINTPEADTNELFIQGGVSQRGKIAFDVSKIPALSAIHSAQLELTLNRDKCLLGNFGIDSTIKSSSVSDINNIGSHIKDYTAELINDKYIISSITSAVERWNRLDGKGAMIFYPDGKQNEYRELDKLSFYGLNEPDSTKRPKLKIIYSKRPKLNK